MALLSTKKRKQMFKALGYGEYNKTSIAKLQKDYLRSKDVDGVYGTNTDNLLRHVYNVKKYTKNFTPKEFKCGCGDRYCTGYPTYMKPSQLSTIQSIRTHFGKPMTITCGLRCYGYNKTLKGAVSNSRHLNGLACDYYIKGVTDTLANRKASISWIKTLPYHRYTYGNGINSNGASVYAVNMGNAMHTDSNDVSVATPTPTTTTATTTTTTTTTPAVTSSSKAEKLAKQGEALAWALGTPTSKYGYKNGKPTSACKSAMRARGYDSKIEYSDCGYFMNTCIYHALGKKVKVLPSKYSSAFPSVSGMKIVISGTSIRQSQLKRGDIIRYTNASRSTQHTLMYLGNGRIAEAGRGKRFGIIKKSKKYTGKKKRIEVLRAIEG